MLSGEEQLRGRLDRVRRVHRDAEEVRAYRGGFLGRIGEYSTGVLASKRHRPRCGVLDSSYGDTPVASTRTLSMPLTMSTPVWFKAKRNTTRCPA